jgi:hypothetical protein
MLVQSLLGYLSGISILSNTYFIAGNPTEIELKNNCTGDYLTIDLSCRLVAVVTDNIKDNSKTKYTNRYTICFFVFTGFWKFICRAHYFYNFMISTFATSNVSNKRKIINKFMY